MTEYTIALYFDNRSEKQIKKILYHLSNVSGNDYMISTNITPHISIGMYNSNDIQSLIRTIESLIRNISNIKSGVIVFDRIDVFKPKVVYLSPRKTKYLTELNQMVSDVMLKQYSPADNGNYLPEKWVPHCALCVKLCENEFDVVLKETKKIKLPFQVKATRIVLAKCNPYKEIKCWKL